MERMQSSIWVGKMVQNARANDVLEPASEFRRMFHRELAHLQIVE
jgi:hypothetical protein